MTELFQASKETETEFYRASSTTAQYTSTVKMGKKWLQEWVDSHRQDEAALLLEHAFDAISMHTPTALRMLCAYKCDTLNLGYATAELIRTSFKAHFKL